MARGLERIAREPSLLQPSPSLLGSHPLPLLLIRLTFRDVLGN